MNKLSLSGSKHFSLNPLGEGVFAAIAEEGGWAICNSGVIDLGGQIVVFDTFLTPQAALDLSKTIIDIFGRAPQIVINSHYHNDHIWGNQVFKTDAQIVSSTRTRTLIATAGTEEFQWYSSNSAQQLARHRELYQNAKDELEQKQELLWIGEYEGIVSALPHLAVCMPTFTFNDHLEIHGSKKTAELIAFEGGHTGSDTVLYLADEGTIFMGDLLFVRCHPYLAEGDPLKLVTALRELSELDANCFIPGHGPAGSVGDLKLLIEYIDHCMETAQMLVARGDTNADKITALGIPDRYQHWQVPQFYSANIRFLCERAALISDDQYTS